MATTNDKQKPAAGAPKAVYRPPDQALGALGRIRELLPDAKPIQLDLRGKMYLAWLPTMGRLFLPEVLIFQSHLDLDTDGYTGVGQDDPAAQANTSLHDFEVVSPAEYNAKGKLVKKAKRVRHDVDANEIPYFVLPGIKGDSSAWLGKDHGIHLGDVGVIIGNDKVVCAEFADVGPTFKLGEASMEVHREFGHDPFKRRKDGSIRGIDDTDLADDHKSSDYRFVTIVFPGSGLGRRFSLDEIRTTARAFFERLGGSMP